MTHKEYNGWTNYETWLVKLWMDNNEGSYGYFREMAEEYYKVDRDNAGGLADAIKEAHQEALPELSGLASDLMGAAMSEVNWHEIAESLMNDAKEALEEEEA